MSTGLDKVQLDVSELLHMDILKFPVPVPVIITHGDTFRVIAKAQEIEVDNHDSDAKPYQLIIRSYGLIQCIVYFDDCDDDLSIHIGVPKEKKEVSVA